MAGNVSAEATIEGVPADAPDPSHVNARAESLLPMHADQPLANGNAGR